MTPTPRPVHTMLLTAVLILGSGAPAAWSATPRGQISDPTPFCGDEGVWIQILGAGGPDLDDGQGGPSYLVFENGLARLLVDTASGASVGFDKAGGKFADLDAIVFTQLRADHATDFPAFVRGSESAGRERLLPVLGPDGNDANPDTETFVERLIGADGAFPQLADFLTFRSSGGYKLSPRNVPATGRREWAQFGSENLRLRAIPANHGNVPALAWKAEIGGMSIVFTGDFNNRNDLMREFARDADALVTHHAITEGARGEATDLHITPGKIGEIAAAADVRMVILGHRTTRTRGLESVSRNAIEEHYTGPLIFANDLECWGL